MEKQYKLMTFADANDQAELNALIDGTTDLIFKATSKKYGHTGIIEPVDYSDLAEFSKNTQKSIINFIQDKTGCVLDQSNPTSIQNALDDPEVERILNTIIVRSMQNALVRHSSPVLDQFVDRATVHVGESKLYELKPIAIGQLQRASVMVNPSLVNLSTKRQMTIQPKMWTDGFTISYTNILTESQDLGYEMARLYAGILFAQYKLISNKLFAAANTVWAPFKAESYASDTFVKIAQNLSLFIDGGVDSVKAFGTPIALHKIAGANVANGFMRKDEFAQYGKLTMVDGVELVTMNQFLGYAAPLNPSADAEEGVIKGVIPNDKVLLIATGADPVIALVQEDYVRVRTVDNQQSALNRHEYAITVSFNAEVISQAPFGVVTVK